MNCLTIRNFDNIGHEIVTLDNKILDNSIDRGIAVLNSRYRYIVEAAKRAWNYDLCEVLEQMGLECRFTILVITQVVEELLDGLAEALVHSISIKLVREEFYFVNDAVSVVAITLTKEEVSAVVELIPLISSAILHNVALLLETLSDVCVDILEPRLELGIFLSVPIECVD
jgi:hypothetical protein